QPVKSSSYDRDIITQDTVPARIQIDSVSWRDLSPQREKKFWRAGAEWLLAQAVPASFNRFITKDPYPYISFQNLIAHQRLSAWDWDDNQCTTNQIDHPCHVSLYFNAFRSNGY